MYILILITLIYVHFEILDILCIHIYIYIVILIENTVRMSEHLDYYFRYLYIIEHFSCSEIIRVPSKYIIHCQ